MILVAGATGRLGSEICGRLRQAGESVAGLLRPGSPGKSRLEGLGVELRRGDLKDTRSLRDACAGAEIVISTATAMSRPCRGDSLESVDRDGQLALVEAARCAGIRRFVYLSLSASLPSTEFVEIKRKIETAVRVSGMEWALLQPAAFMEIWLSRELGWDFAGGKARIVGDGKQKISLISIADVAAFAALAATNPRMKNRSLPLGGPEAVSPLEIVDLYQDLTGQRLGVHRVPVAVLRTLALLVRPISRVQSELMLLGAAVAERGDAVDMTSVLEEFPLRMRTVRDHLRNMASPATHP